MPSTRGGTARGRRRGRQLLLLRALVGPLLLLKSYLTQTPALKVGGGGRRLVWMGFGCAAYISTKPAYRS